MVHVMCSVVAAWGKAIENAYNLKNVMQQHKNAIQSMEVHMKKITYSWK